MHIRTTLLSFILVLIFAGQVCHAQEMEKSESKIKHIVLVWLKEPGDMEAQQRIIEASKSFREGIPGVLDVSTGNALNRERVDGDNPFDVALIITFKDEQSLKNYDTHPKHRKAVEEILLPVTDKITVYDFVVQ